MTYTTNENDNAVMFPGIEYNGHDVTLERIYENEYDASQLAQFLADIEATDDGLNMIESWVTCCRDCDALSDGPHLFYDSEDGPSTFELIMLMPRKMKFIVWRLKVPRGQEFPHARLDNWIDEYVKPRVLRWYGFDGMLWDAGKL